MAIEKPGAVFSTDALEFIPSPKRVRARFGSDFIADSTRPGLLREKGHRPVYYFPREDVRNELLEQTNRQSSCPRKGTASYWTVRSGGRAAKNAAWAYLDPKPGAEPLADYLAFDWNAMDAWFEEDEKIDIHPRDPYHRIDVRQSSRHVQVFIGKELVAETRRPTLLFETELPVRYYLPRIDVDLSVLESSEMRTGCPYKGEARYYHVVADGEQHEDLVWFYPFPRPEAVHVAGQLCFFQERVSRFVVDGQVQEKPETPWQ